MKHLKSMKIGFAAALVVLTVTLTSCATIFGGRTYYAHVLVDGDSKAEIAYKGQVIGKGQAIVKVPRSEANKLTFVVNPGKDQNQEFKFTGRSFRTLAFIGSAVTWTGLYNGIPLPWGVALDFSTGAVWKPDVHEPGISNIGGKHYQYLLNYTETVPIAE